MGKRSDEPGCVPSTFFYTFCATDVVVPILSALMRIHARPDKAFVRGEGPTVILGNHPSYLDPFVVMRLTRGRKVNFVAGEFLFRNRIWGYMFRRAGIIRIRQFSRDTSAARAMMKVLSRGGVLAIFPEATRFTDGSSIAFDDGVARLIKKAGADVWFVESHGAYLTYPRWSNSFLRLGRVDAKFRSHIDREEVGRMSVEQLHKAMIDNLEYNENDYIRQHPVEFHNRNIASGLQNVAYACPKCGREFVMEFKGGDKLSCRECGLEVRMKKTGLLEGAGDIDDLHKYVLWEQSLIEEQISDPKFCMTTDVDLMRPFDEVDFSLVGKGRLTITSDEMIYEGTDSAPENGIVYHKGKVRRGYADRTLSGERTVLRFGISSMKGVIASYGKYVEVHDRNGDLMRFGMDGGKAFKIQKIVYFLGKLNQ